MPRNSRSSAAAGSYRQRRSPTKQPTMAQKSSRVCHSRPLRARREASRESTSPTSPAADGADQAIETRPQHAVAGGALVLVDHLHVAEPQLARMVGQRVLQPLALDVVTDLEVGRLAHVDAGLAPQLRGRERSSGGCRHLGLPGAGPWPAGAAGPRSAPPGPRARPAARGASGGSGARTGVPAARSGGGVACDASLPAGDGSRRKADSKSRRSASAARDRRGTARRAPLRRFRERHPQRNVIALSLRVGNHHDRRAAQGAAPHAGHPLPGQRMEPVMDGDLLIPNVGIVWPSCPGCR